MQLVAVGILGLLVFDVVMDPEVSGFVIATPLPFAVGVPESLHETAPVPELFKLTPVEATGEAYLVLK